MSRKPATEHQEQKALIEWARMRTATLPELKMLIAIPNGGKRARITGALLKAEGTRAGFPDLFLFVPRPPYCGLAIEMKRQSGGRLSLNQTLWIEFLQTQGYRAEVCYGWQHAAQVIEGYLAMGKACG